MYLRRKKTQGYNSGNDKDVYENPYNKTPCSKLRGASTLEHYRNECSHTHPEAFSRAIVDKRVLRPGESGVFPGGQVRIHVCFFMLLNVVGGRIIRRIASYGAILAIGVLPDSDPEERFY
jgi:hypothetical protein